MKKKKYYFYIWKPRYRKSFTLLDNDEWRTLPGLDAEIRRREMWGDDYEDRATPYVPLYMGMNRSPYLDISLCSGVNVESKPNLLKRAVNIIKGFFN